MKFIVNNALSHEVDRAFNGAIISREVVQKNRILYEIDETQNKAMLKYFMNRFKIKEVI